jgi:hypothetical protein
MLVSEEISGLVVNESKTGVDSAVPFARFAELQGRGFLLGETTGAGSISDVRFPFVGSEDAGVDFELIERRGRSAHGFVVCTAEADALFAAAAESTGERAGAAEAESDGEDANGEDALDVVVGPESCMFWSIGRIIIPTGDARKR